MSENKGNPRVTLRVTQGLYEAMQKHAKLRRQRVSDWVREVVSDAVVGLPLPAVTDADGVPGLEATGRYFGTTVADDWLDRVVARGLGTRSGCRIALSPAGMDVHRASDSFRIPAPALVGARAARGLAGKVVPPHGLLVVTWRHGDYVLDTGFRLTEVSGARPAIAGHPPDKSVHETWIREIEEIVKENAT